MDSLSDTDRIFVSKSVDEVAQYCRDMQYEIAGTQDQLRQLIGKQYRDLLDCCDLVVGMDDVCEQINARWNELRAHEQVTRATHRLNAFSAPASDTRAKMCQATFGALSLLRGARLHDGVVEYKRAKSYTEELAAQHSTQGAATSSRVLDLIPQVFEAAALAQLLRIAALPPTMSPAALYDDLHAAVERWYDCTRGAAVEKVVAFHAGAMTRACGDSAGLLVLTLAARAFSYVAQMCERGSPVISPPAAALSLASLLAVDTHQTDFESILYEHVCGHRVLQEGTEKTSALDGWTSPMPSHPVKVDKRCLEEIVVAAASCTADYVQRADTVVSLIRFRRAATELFSKTYWGFEKDGSCSALSKQLDVKVQRIVLDRINEVANALITKHSTSTTDALRALLGADADSRWDALHRPTLAPPSDALTRLLEAARRRGDSKPRQSRFEADSKNVADGLITALRDVAHEQLGSGLINFMIAAAVKPREICAAILNQAKLGHSADSTAAVRAAWILGIFTDTLTSVAASSGHEDSFARQIDELREVERVLMLPWADGVAQTVRSTAAEGVQLLQRPDLPRPTSWTGQVVNGATLHLPNRTSPWVVTSYMRLYRQAKSNFPSAAMPLSTHQLLLGRWAREVFAVRFDLDEATQHGLLQLWLDLCVVSASARDESVDQKSVAVLRELQKRVEPAAATLAESELVRVARDLSKSLRLLFSGVNTDAPAKPEQRVLVLARDASRISNVPLPTAPKPLVRLTLPPAGTQPPQPTSDQSGFTKLRGLMGVWS
jgi:hypothetical protein